MLKGSIIMKITGFLKKYSHAWVFLYGLIYMPWFLYLENHVSKDYYLIHSPLDDYIPFIEYFIVPYLLWFVFIAVIVSPVRFHVYGNDNFSYCMHRLSQWT